ncbi:hypothetical protein [Halosimplex sp. J119]
MTRSDRTPGDDGIDRRALVERHAVTLTDPDPLAPLSVGNGTFTFTADEEEAAIDGLTGSSRR